MHLWSSAYGKLETNINTMILGTRVQSSLAEAHAVILLTQIKIYI